MATGGSSLGPGGVSHSVTATLTLDTRRCRPQNVIAHHRHCSCCVGWEFGDQISIVGVTAAALALEDLEACFNGSDRPGLQLAK